MSVGLLVAIKGGLGEGGGEVRLRGGWKSSGRRLLVGVGTVGGRYGDEEVRCGGSLGF